MSLALTGCTKPNPEVCCTTLDQCSEIGVNDLRTCNDGLVCQDNRCVAASDGGVDATSDAVIDAGVRAFEVAYPDEWRFSVPGPISGYFLAINTSNADLDMNTLELKSLDDDHPTAIVRVTISPSTTLIPPGFVGGALSGLSTQILVNSGLVPESRYDTTSDYLTLAIENAPDAMYDVHVDLVIAIGGIRIPMPMTIHMLPSGSIYANPLAGTRVVVFR